jgi:hypothetical protein
VISIPPGLPPFFVLPRKYPTPDPPISLPSCRSYLVSHVHVGFCIKQHLRQLTVTKQGSYVKRRPTFLPGTKAAETGVGEGFRSSRRNSRRSNDPPLPSTPAPSPQHSRHKSHTPLPPGSNAHTREHFGSRLLVFMVNNVSIVYGSVCITCVHVCASDLITGFHIGIGGDQLLDLLYLAHLGCHQECLVCM